MRQIQVESFVKFIEQTDTFDLLGETVVFRGQPCPGNLPSVATQNRPCMATSKPAI
jgi:hypothetical protein